MSVEDLIAVEAARQLRDQPVMQGDAGPLHPAYTGGLRDAALRATVWGVIADAAKDRQAEAKAELQALEVGDTLAAKWDGQLVGKVSMSNGRAKIVVTDEQALLAWVRAHHPTELIESVNPAFLKTFGHVDGQVHWQGEPVDFMAVVQGDPYVTVRKDAHAEDVVVDLLASGCVSLDALDTKALENVVDAEVLP